MPRSIAIPAPLSCTLTQAAQAAESAVAHVLDRLGRKLGAALARSAPGSASNDATGHRAINLAGNLAAGLDSTARQAASAILPPRTRARRALAASPDPTSDRKRASAVPLAQQGDEELFVLHRSGHPDALRILIERYAGELHGFLTRLVGSRAGADDVFQEAFLQVHLAAETFDADRRFRPWLYTIAANKGRDFLRRQRRRTAVSLDAPVSSGSEAALIDLLPGANDAPSTPLESTDERAIVKQVIDEMPPHFREILLLSYFQKLSYAQISDSLSIPLGTVKSRLHAAVASFAQSWKLACARRGIQTPPTKLDSDA